MMPDSGLYIQKIAISALNDVAFLKEMGYNVLTMQQDTVTIFLPLWQNPVC